jgi:heme-degrading monooxygenase HmoA
MSQILKNLPVGSYAVIFPSVSSGVDEEGHEKMLATLYGSAQEVDGYLGLESASIGSFKLSIAYYDSLEAINRWKTNGDHIAAKNKARSTWLEDWQIRICKIEDVYGKA